MTFQRSGRADGSKNHSKGGRVGQQGRPNPNAHTHARARARNCKEEDKKHLVVWFLCGGWVDGGPLPRASHLLSLGSESFVETLPSVPFSQKRTSLSYAALNLCTKRSFSSSWGLLP